MNNILLKNADVYVGVEHSVDDEVETLRIQFSQRVDSTFGGVIELFGTNLKDDLRKLAWFLEEESK